MVGSVKDFMSFVEVTLFVNLLFNFIFLTFIVFIVQLKNSFIYVKDWFNFYRRICYYLIRCL